MIFSQNSHFKLIFSITMLLSHCWVRSLFCRPYENWPNNEPPGQEVLWNCSVDLFSNTQMCAVVAVLCLIRIGLNVWGSGLGTVILMFWYKRLEIFWYLSPIYLRHYSSKSNKQYWFIFEIRLCLNFALLFIKKFRPHQTTVNLRASAK